MPTLFETFVVSILSSSGMIWLTTVPGHTRDIDLDFYRLSPGMTTKEVSATIGKPLPQRCHAKGNELKFEGKEGVYTIYLDSHGHFFRMEWRQARPAPLITEDAFRTLAERHKCGGGKSFEIEHNTGMFRSGTDPMTPKKTHEGFTAKFQGHDHIQLRLSLNHHAKNEYYLSCFRLRKDERFRFEDSCRFGMLPCPSRSRSLTFRGLRF